MQSITVSSHPSVQYLLRIGDTCLILAQRLAEWCGHAPIVEEDIALTNMALDLVGQARAVLTRAGQLEGELGGTRHDEDQLAFLRDERDFRNCTLVELPRGDFAVTMLSNLRRRDLPRAALAAARRLERRRARRDRRQGRQGSALPPRARRRLGRSPRRRHGGIGGAPEGGARPALAVLRRDLRGRRRRRRGRRGAPRPALGRPARRLARRLRRRPLGRWPVAAGRARVPQHRQDRPPQRAPRLRAGRDAASAALVSGRRVVMIDAAFGTPLPAPPLRGRRQLAHRARLGGAARPSSIPRCRSSRSSTSASSAR